MLSVTWTLRGLLVFVSMPAILAIRLGLPPLHNGLREAAYWNYVANTVLAAANRIVSTRCCCSSERLANRS